MGKGKFNLKKMFIEEEESYEELPSVSYDFNAVAEEPQKVIVNISSNVSTIKDIYLNENLSDLSQSIYKVEEIKKVLPNTLPLAAKKESVIGMMQVSGLALEDLIKDANYRKTVLSSVMDGFTQQTISIIDRNEVEINDLEDKINKLKEEINNRKLAQEQQEKIVNDEISKIDEIIGFIG